VKVLSLKTARALGPRDSPRESVSGKYSDMPRRPGDVRSPRHKRTSRADETEGIDSKRRLVSRMPKPALEPCIPTKGAKRKVPDRPEWIHEINTTATG
jgi:hypothetical protein